MAAIESLRMAGATDKEEEEEEREANKVALPDSELRKNVKKMGVYLSGHVLVGWTGLDKSN